MEEIYFFGDSTTDCRLAFHTVFTKKDNVLLQSFLEQVCEAIRAEDKSRSFDDNASALAFSTVQELVDRYCDGIWKDPAIESALVCTSQLAHFIGISEERIPAYISPQKNAGIFGACTGLIAATAVSVADSLTALIPLAIEAVRVAFRIGQHASRVGQRIHIGNNNTWSTVVVGDESLVRQALDAFHTRNNIPEACKVWISAFSASAITISGPPYMKERLFDESEFFQESKTWTVPIYAPYHAAHIHTVGDIEKVLLPDTKHIFGEAKPQFNLFSSVSGDLIQGESALDLLREALKEILLKPLNLSRVLHRCVSASAQATTLFTIGHTNFSHSLFSALKTNKVSAAMKDLTSWRSEAPSGTKKSKREADIAIVGMSGRFPDAANHELFWDLLEQGLDVHRPVPPDRYPVDSHTDPNKKKKNTSHTPFGNFIEDPGLFDARFFNMSPREAVQTDPMQRLIMTTAYEAMEMGGIVPGRTPSTKHDRIGTFYGQTSDDWREVNAAQDIDTYFISGGVRAFGPGRLNFFFKFSGPSFSVDTACSSSFAAMNVAITSLRAGECDTAITGGTNVLTNPDIFSGLSRGHFLSPTGSCKTWDDEADGYCRGDGVCTVIFKRLQDAIDDKDPILGVIRGIGTNHSAQAVSITHPCAENQAFLFDKVVRECNVDARDVNYVEMHGTGTQAGDSIEMESVSTVFAPRANKRKPDQPLYVGAVKSNIGHGEAVSGVSALIKVLLMLQKEKIPPHTGIKKALNHTFASDLSERGLHIALETTNFPRPKGGKRIVFINNFSAAGGNTAMLLEDGPRVRSKPAKDHVSTQVVTVSAKSLASFKKNLSQMLSFVESEKNIYLPDLAYTTTARRAHYTYRSAFAVDTIEQLGSSIRAEQASDHSPISIDRPQLAFVFTGQGSQYTAMGRKLYETCEQFRNDLNEFDEICHQFEFPSIKPLIEGSAEIHDMPPTVIQLGMCCIQIALTRLWSAWGIKPQVVIGHSLGEYAALQAASVISVTDTIYLVGKRALLLEQNCIAGTHAMLAVRCSVSTLHEIVAQSKGKLEIACINGLMDTVLSGTMIDIDAAAQQLADDGQKCTKLLLPYAFHSSQVAPILEDFEQLAGSVTFHKPSIPVISPLLNDVVSSSGTFTKTYLSKHCRKTVDFVGGLAAAMSNSIISPSTVWIEIGGHPLCSSMLRSCISTSALPSLRRDEDPWKTISSSLSILYQDGYTLNWDIFHRNTQDLVCLHGLPAYGFDEKNFWLQYSGDWLLYKGDFPKTITEVFSDQRHPAKESKSLSTAVQAVISEDIMDSVAIVVAESDLADTKLWPVIKGHLVNGVGLCPSSLYADQALTLVDHTYKLLRPNEKVHCNIGAMDNPAPLILKNQDTPESQVMTLTCRVDLAERKADFTVTSHNGKKDIVHAKCIILFEDVNVWKEDWNRNSYLIQSRIDLLKAKLETGEANQVSRTMAYRLFTALVDYSNPYQGMQSVIFDGSEFEAVSNIKFRCRPEDGEFLYSPFCIDSTAHLSGFTVNATVNAQEECFISHGWSSLRILEPFAYDKSYKAYVKMQPVPGSKMRVGDVWIFDDEDEVIGVVGGLRFQCIPRKVMDIMMPKPKATGKVTTQANIVKPMPTPVVQGQSISSNEKASSSFARTQKTSASPELTHTGIVAKAFDIIAAETAVDQSELQEDIQWADLGVDSLMSLTISGKFREELELDVESSIFTDHPSVGALKKHFLKLFDRTQHAALHSDSLSDTTDDSSVSSEDVFDSGITTPYSDDYQYKLNDASTNPSVRLSAQEIPSSTNNTIETIRNVIAEEMEMDLAEITDTTDLSNLGMDSLMALTVLGKLREEHDIDLDPSLFAENPSLSHLRKVLEPEHPVPSSPIASATFQKSQNSSTQNLGPQMATAGVPLATSVLLQGNSRTATRNLFLFPDGSGSATSYAFIPTIDSKNLAVYGLNCPFMKDPTSYTCGIEGVSKLYLQEVMRRQPTGPWLLGGWSAGGVVAYEVTRQIGELAKTRNDKSMYVEKLVLIDSPCPIRLEPLPARLHHFFDEIGLLGAGTGKSPKWLLPHFEYSIKALTAYRPETKSLKDFQAPPTLLIWATDGVCGNPEDPRPPPQADDPKSMKWLLENRTDFGPNGWDKLLDPQKCTMVKVVGNHFTMMRPPVAHEVGRCIRESL